MSSIIRHIKILISKQRLYLVDDKKVIKQYPVSTSRLGTGNKKDSYRTPLGIHVICSKIGRNAPSGSVFIKRRNTGKIAKIHRKKGACESDKITSRIIRLQGLEKGVNCGKGIDSYKRCIYIHGTSDEWLIGKPASHGCIRMKNRDIIELFDLVKRGARVCIMNKKDAATDLSLY